MKSFSRSRQISHCSLCSEASWLCCSGQLGFTAAVLLISSADISLTHLFICRASLQLLNAEITSHFLTRWIFWSLPPCSPPRPPRSASTSFPTSRRRTSCTSSLNTSAARTAWPTRTADPRRSYDRGLGVSGTWWCLCFVVCWRI